MTSMLDVMTRILVIVRMNSNSSTTRAAGSPATSSENRRFWLLTLLYPATAVASSQGVLQLELPKLAGGALAVLPFIPGVLWIRAMLRTMRLKLDELQWRLFIETVAFIPPGLLGVAVSVDIFRHAGLLPDFAWTTRTLALATAALFFLGGRVVERRYK